MVAEHEAIVDAIEWRDANSAEARLREHLHTSEYVLARSKSKEGAWNR